MSNEQGAPAPRAIGVAIIGSGLMAQSHSMAWHNLRAVYGDIGVDIRLVMLVDVTPELAERGARRFGYERWATTWREAVEHPEVDLIDIVTPNHLHEEVAIAAAEAGKHIWCEKPLATTAEGAARMAEAAERAGAITLVGFSYLRNPALALAKRLVDAGEIGEPVSFTGCFALDAMTDPAAPFTWRQDRALAGTGALGDLGAHVIAIARMLVGGIASVSGLSRTTVPRRPLAAGGFGYGEEAAEDAPTREVENDDVTLLLARFANGAIGTIESSRVAPGRAFDLSFTLTGTRGAIRFDQQRMHELLVRLASDPEDSTGFRHIDAGPGHGDYGRLWPFPGAMVGLHDLKLFEARALVDAILEEHPAWPDFREGWQVERIIDAVDRSARDGGAWRELAQEPDRGNR